MDAKKRKYKHTRNELIQESIEFRDQIDGFYQRYNRFFGMLHILKQIIGKKSPPKSQLNKVRRDMIECKAKGVVGLDRRDDVIQMIKDKEYKDA